MPCGLLEGRQTLFDEPELSDWMTRAWTFQEYLLSRKCLIFTRYEAFFQCTKEEYREAYDLFHLSASTPGPARPHPGPPRFFNHQNTLRSSFLSQRKLEYADWAQLVHLFSARQLTYRGDRLDAFQAVIARFADDNSVAGQAFAESGIPLRFMYPFLTWDTTYSTNEYSTRICEDARKSRTSLSWPWAGWSGVIDVQNSYPTMPGRLAFEVLDENNIVGCPTNSDDKFWPE